MGAQQILEGEGRKEYPSEAPEKLVTNRIKAEMLQRTDEKKCRIISEMRLGKET